MIFYSYKYMAANKNEHTWIQRKHKPGTFFESSSSQSSSWYVAVMFLVLSWIRCVDVFLSGLICCVVLFRVFGSCNIARLLLVYELKSDAIEKKCYWYSNNFGLSLNRGCLLWAWRFEYCFYCCACEGLKVLCYGWWFVWRKWFQGPLRLTMVRSGLSWRLGDGYEGVGLREDRWLSV